MARMNRDSKNWCEQQESMKIARIYMDSKNQYGMQESTARINMDSQN